MRLFRCLAFLSFVILGCSDVQEKQIPGALAALQYQSEARSYPNELPPSSGFYEAFEYKLAEFESTTKTRSGSNAWETLGPWNTAGRTLAVAIHPSFPNTIWAGSAAGGLWKSEEFGKDTSWRYVETGFPVLGVASIALSSQDDSVMYIGTGEVYNLARSGDGAAYRVTRGTPGIGILKSSDYGVTWSLVLDWANNQNTGVQHIEVSSQFPEQVYAATTEGVMMSPDGGTTWQNVLDVPMVTDIGIDPFDNDRIVAICGNFNSDRKGIYYTTDGGESWSLASGSVPDFNGKGRIDWSKSKQGVLYASIGDGFSTSDPTATWTLKSTDGGETWAQVSTVDYSRWQGWFAHDIAVHPTSPDTIIGIGIYIHKSEKSGSQFEQITRNPQVTSGRPSIPGPDGPTHYTHVDHHAIIYHPTNFDTVLVACDGGIFISVDGGETWESRNGGMQTTQFYNGVSISMDNEDLFMGGLQDNNSVIYDGDFAWTRTLGGDGSYTAIDPDFNNIMFASYQYLNIFRSTEDGRNWQRIFSPQGDDESVFIAPYYLHPQDPAVMYAASNFVYFSEDQGENWIRTNDGQPLDGGNPIYSLGLAPNNPSVAYAGTAPFTEPSKVFVTRDAGSTWDQIGEGTLPDRYPVDIAVDHSNDARAVVCFSGYGSGHVFLTQDFGATWIDITNNLPDVPTNAVVFDANHPNSIYVGNDLGVYYSEDAGNTWSSFNDGLPQALVVSDLVLSNETKKIYVATHGNGVYRNNLIEPVTTSSRQDNIGEIQAYPSVLDANGTLFIKNIELESSEYYYRLVALTGEIIAQSELNSTSIRLSDISVLPSGSFVLQIMNDHQIQLLNHPFIIQ